MTRTIEIVLPAAEGERFTPGALDYNIGKPVRLCGGDVVDGRMVQVETELTATLLAAEVIEDGSAVRLTLELP